jgi:DNA-binding response OmpR family regulator
MPPLPIILLIDDDPDEYFILKLFLKHDVARLDWSRTAVAGIIMAQLIKPNVIILDQYMPGSDAVDTLREIKATEELKNIPIIISTGTINPKAKEKLLEAGAINVYEKPVRVGVLNEIINTNKYVS